MPPSVHIMMFARVCLDLGPVRSVCDGQRLQGVFSARAVPAVPLAEDRDSVLQEPGLRLRTPTVFRTQNSRGGDANLPDPCETHTNSSFTTLSCTSADEMKFLNSLSLFFFFKLLQMLENFRVEKQRNVEARSTFELILLPDKPIILTLKPLQANR